VDPLERHRLVLYGRIGLSIATFLVAMAVATAAVISGAPRSNAIAVAGCLIGSILVLPRKTRPRSEKARETAEADELERFEKIRTWLTWTRGVYLVVAIAVLVGLPRLL